MECVSIIVHRAIWMFNDFIYEDLKLWNTIWTWKLVIFTIVTRKLFSKNGPVSIVYLYYNTIKYIVILKAVIVLFERFYGR